MTAPDKGVHRRVLKKGTQSRTEETQRFTEFFSTQISEWKSQLLTDGASIRLCRLTQYGMIPFAPGGVI
jgi:hypothetical protein